MPDYDDMIRLGAAYIAGPTPDDEDDQEVCADGYPEHLTRMTYSGPDGVQWECLRCRAEGREPAEEG